jgi:hypothetical protein
VSFVDQPPTVAQPRFGGPSERSATVVLHGDSMQPFLRDGDVPDYCRDCCLARIPTSDTLREVFSLA